MSPVPDPDSAAAPRSPGSPTQRAVVPAQDRLQGRSPEIPSPVELCRSLPGLTLMLSFAVLAEELHYTNAARRLFISQSGLSRRIAQLEQLVGAALIDRSTRQLALTPAGTAVLQFAHSLLNAASVLQSRLHTSLEANGLQRTDRPPPTSLANDGPGSR